MEALTLDRRKDVALVGTALAAALLAFQAWLPGTAFSAILLLGLVGLRRGLPIPVVIASTAAAGSALVHFAVAPEHFAEWWGFGLFFVLSAEVQLGWALFLGRSRSARALVIGLIGSLSLVAVWAVSRTSGLPFGPEAGAPETIGVPDLVSVALELVTAVACAWALLAPNRLAGRVGPSARVLVLVLTVALTAWALDAIGAA